MTTDDEGEGPHGEKRRHARAEVTLLVDYQDADDLVGDYTDNLSSGGTFVATGRALPHGTRVRLALSFPGLMEPIHVDGEVRWSRTGDEAGVGIEFLEGEGRDRLAAIIERVRTRDPRVIAQLVRVLVVEDNPHVAAMVRSGLAGMGRRGGEAGTPAIIRVGDGATHGSPRRCTSSSQATEANNRERTRWPLAPDLGPAGR